MIAEYVAIAGAPAGSDPWPLVLDIAQRSGQYEARTRLALLDSVSAAIGGAMGDAGSLDSVRSRLERIAYPSRKATPLMPNIFAEGSDG